MQWANYQSLVKNLLTMADALSNLMYNQNPDVRKSVVFCLVEIHTIINDNALFEKEFLSNLNQSQQKLVDIYITRKRQS